MKIFTKKFNRRLAMMMTAVTVAMASTTSLSLPVKAATASMSENSIITFKNDAPTSERIQQLIDTAMHFYWNGGDLKQAEKDIFKGITLKGKYDVVENAFKQATVLDPYNIDLKMSLASTQIVQKKIPEALRTYEQILHLQPDHFNANLLYGMYSKLNGNELAYKQSINNLRKIDADQTNSFVQKFKETEEILGLKMNTEVPKGLPSKDHAIVILGYALAEDGTMQETLVERLKQGLKLAQQYPDSKIIVTGGVPKNGVTEADNMTKWLVEQGIAKERILPENKATDTVESALFSTEIIEEQGIKDVTVVTSASHIRRSVALFKEADRFYSKMNGKEAKRNFTNMVYMDYETVEEAHEVPKSELLVVYRDLFRTAGLWQYPGIQR
ncbi:Uncharacterized conserved protein [Paenibacillus uliginis N3/975]|uniref:Uncharacterized conserved protein n=1 Tax=Paenibacillus uliginis N3/975 TaxID=1313296 RepID=A0A1X7HGV0_9BACL|nr:YdcF family protein [Paenibacillus uliginis]SMF86495.1 Uncharacterized conserved protein [Paenibacillus uliginis N3/975]